MGWRPVNKKNEYGLWSVNYLVPKTRPNLAFAFQAVSRLLNCPTAEFREALSHIFKYLRGTAKYTIVLGGAKIADDSPRLLSYSDADWGPNDQGRRSISGYVFMFRGVGVSWSEC